MRFCSGDPEGFSDVFTDYSVVVLLLLPGSVFPPLPYHHFCVFICQFIEQVSVEFSSVL
jgi:hypothetical protein